MGKMKTFLKRVLPMAFINRLKRFKIRIKTLIYRQLSKSARFSAFYFALFSRKFIREQQGVMYGIWKYYQEPWATQHTQYALRRNIHRLEKGLLMKPRRDVFALGYITETVDSYENIITSCEELDDSCKDQTGMKEIEWAHDVLTEYFNSGADHPIINAARNRFLTLANVPAAGHCVPYKRDQLGPSPVKYAEFMALSRRRKSVRWYEQKPVPRELIDDAILAASFAPSACNRQPFEFRVFDDAEMIQNIASLPGGAEGFRQNFSVLVVIVGKLHAYFNEADRHLIYIDSSLAAMAFMYALETLGLSSCAINWQDSSRSKQMAGLLGLSPDEQVIMLISLGYPDPDGLVAYSQKKELDLLRRYNQ